MTYQKATMPRDIHITGSLLALLNANRFVFVLHLARLRPAAKNSRNQLLFS